MDRCHHVVLAPGTQFVPAQIAEHTAPILERILFDEIRRLNLCGGWLLRDGTEKEAHRIVEIAQKYQLDHRLVISAGSSTKVGIIRTIRIVLDDDRNARTPVARFVRVAFAPVIADPRHPGRGARPEHPEFHAEAFANKEWKLRVV